MVYAFIQDVPVTEAQYRRITESLGPDPLEGLLMHLCVRRDDGGLRYIDVWESIDSCTRAFDNRIHAAVDEAFSGRRPSLEPEMKTLEVLDIRGTLISGTTAN